MIQVFIKNNMIIKAKKNTNQLLILQEFWLLHRLWFALLPQCKETQNIFKGQKIHTKTLVPFAIVQLDVLVGGNMHKVVK